MSDIAFVILYLSFPIIIITIMQVSGLSILKITIPSFAVISMFVLGYIGLIVLYFGWDEYRFDMVQDRAIMFKVFCYVCVSITNLVFGIIFTKKILKFSSLNVLNKNFQGLNSSEVRTLGLLLLFSFIVLAIYISKLSQLAIVVAFVDGIRESKVARSLMGNSFSGKYHWYKLIMIDLMNLITFTFFAALLKERRNKIYFILFLLSFLGSIFTAVMATEKAPLGWLLIGLFLTYLLIKKDGVISLKLILKILIIVMIPLIVLNIYFMGASSILRSISSVLSRAFTGQIQPAYHYLEFFPNNHPFLWGTSFPNPGGFLPFEPYELTKEMMNWKFPADVKNGIVGSMPTAFWGELYANFGTIGVFLGSFLLGIIIQFLSSIVYMLENSPIKIGLIVWLLLHYKNIALTGASAFFMDFYAIGIFVFVMFTLIICNKGKIKYYKD